MAKTGNNLLVAVGGTVIAGMKTCSVETESELLETCSSASSGTGAARTYIAGRTGWTVTVSGLVVNDVGSFVLERGTTVTLSFGMRDSNTSTIGSDARSGTAICTRARVDGARGNLLIGSWEFTGSGELST